MKLITKIGKKDILSIIAGAMVITGAFGPWLWRGYDSYQEVNNKTGKVELHYRLISKISPFFILIIPESNEPVTNWFVSSGATLAGVILIFMAFLFVFKFERLWVKGLIFLFSLLACFFFFLNLGRGLWLGLLTHFDWGFKMTFIGLMLMFISLFAEIFS